MGRITSCGGGRRRRWRSARRTPPVAEPLRNVLVPLEAGNPAVRHHDASVDHDLVQVLGLRVVDDVADRVAQARHERTVRPPEQQVGLAAGGHPDRELADPALFVEVNIGGTTHVLDAARRTSSVGRCIVISSGAVYGAGTVDGPDPQPESAPARLRPASRSERTRRSPGGRARW
ncbi:NAD-dependent epimerase/dehydratase family protein [Pseudonocardia adelaidensis]|uniref:NAD-dependent epimerase/dehydratase family protein n=1 Tax=Pseudonocardia adelaidensis TaxID=648754 RepID=UPI003CD09D7E